VGKGVMGNPTRYGQAPLLVVFLIFGGGFSNDPRPVFLPPRIKKQLENAYIVIIYIIYKYIYLRLYII
jgi:hypothetical protein